MKCKCGNEFEPMYRNGLLITKLCFECLIRKGKEKQKKDWCKEKSEMKAKLKTKSEWLNDFQKVFNTFIRERDLGKPCISCNKQLRGKYDAGHMFTVGAYPNIRFNEDNVHGQCVECNQHKHGNVAEYAIMLPLRIGQERYEKLLQDRNKSANLSIEDIKELIFKYKEKTKDIRLKRNGFFDKTNSDILSDKF